MSQLPGLVDGRLKNPALLHRGPLADALSILNRGGEETRLVGGAVRDLALGAEVGDFDLATTASPNEVIRRAESGGFKVVLTGVEHGTVTLVFHGLAIETTTLREDVETDGRHARVVFGRDFEADARRRDFTINALSLGIDGRIYDSVGGLEDLAQGRVRFIGDADQRIREDYLRILRLFRFSARFGEGHIDETALSAAIRNRAGLERLSRERVRSEILKTIVAPYAGDVVQTMAAFGFLEAIFGSLGYPARFRRAIAIEVRRGVGTDMLARLEALGVVIREDAERLRERLRLSNAEFRRLANAAAAFEGLHGLEAPPSIRDLRALLLDAGRLAARDALGLAFAESTASDDDHAFASADLFLAQAPTPELPVSGSDLLARGVSAGPRVGEILAEFRRRWVEAGFPEDAATIELLLASAMEREPLPAGAPVRWSQ